MPKERFFISEDLSEGQQIVLEGPEYHHLVNVMRGAIGDCFECVNGHGTYAKVQLTSIEKKKAILVVTEIKFEPKPERSLIVAQAIPKVNKLDFIIEKGTELGMTALWLFPGERSEKKDLSENQLERLKNLAIAALKQCGRLYLPEIVLMPPLSKWSPVQLSAYFGSLDPNAPSLYGLLSQEAQNSSLFFVGPEAGFSENEKILLPKLNAQAVTLNPNILRTETAAVAFIAIAACVWSKPLQNHLS